VIVPDINLLVYAHNEAAPSHAGARVWWQELLTRDATVAIPWAVILGFVRVVTHPRVLVAPLRPAAALDRVADWLGCPGVRILEPGPRHLEIVRELLEAVGVAGNLTTDAHLAALAIEHQGELHSNDADFGRFPGLRWHNPLARKSGARK
jgi:toxin-antitoxin system PIN domain toxin